MATEGPIQGMITQKSEYGIRVEGYENWFNYGKQYNGPVLQEGMQIEFTYNPWLNPQSQKTAYYLVDVRPMNGGPQPAQPAPAAAQARPLGSPQETSFGPVAPTSYQGYHDQAQAAVDQMNAEVLRFRSSSDAISMQVCLKAAVDSRIANLEKAQDEDVLAALIMPKDLVADAEEMFQKLFVQQGPEPEYAG